MARQIEITVGADGAVTVDAQGFQGPSCKAATKAFEDALAALGGAVVAAEDKAELRAPQRAAAAARQQLGRE